MEWIASERGPSVRHYTLCDGGGGDIGPDADQAGDSAAAAAPPGGMSPSHDAQPSGAQSAGDGFPEADPEVAAERDAIRAEACDAGTPGDGPDPEEVVEWT